MISKVFIYFDKDTGDFSIGDGYGVNGDASTDIITAFNDYASAKLNTITIDDLDIGQRFIYNNDEMIKLNDNKVTTLDGVVSELLEGDLVKLIDEEDDTTKSENDIITKLLKRGENFTDNIYTIISLYKTSSDFPNEVYLWHALVKGDGSDLDLDDIANNYKYDEDDQVRVRVHNVRASKDDNLYWTRAPLESDTIKL